VHPIHCSSDCFLTHLSKVAFLSLRTTSYSPRRCGRKEREHCRCCLVSSIFEKTALGKMSPVQTTLMGTSLSAHLERGQSLGDHWSVRLFMGSSRRSPFLGSLTNFSATVLLECKCDFELGFQCELRM
jgi:hypothetical protein